MNVISGYKELFKDQNYVHVNNQESLPVKNYVLLAPNGL